MALHNPSNAPPSPQPTIGWHIAEDLLNGPGKQLRYWNGTTWDTKRRRTSYGGFFLRVISGIIDVALIALPFYGLLLLAYNHCLDGAKPEPTPPLLPFLSELGTNTTLFLALASAIFTAANLTYFGFLHGWGKTPGMAIVHQTMVGHDGYSVKGTFHPLIVLFVFRYLLLVIPFLDLLWCIWDSRKQTLAEKAAGLFWVQTGTEYAD